jgi:hypothetical protein
MPESAISWKRSNDPQAGHGAWAIFATVFPEHGGELDARLKADFSAARRPEHWVTEG